jgi:hypothetical protein
VKDAVAIEKLFAGNGGDTVAGDDDACEVHRVGSRDWDDVGAFATARGAERFHGLGEGVLFADEAGDETASADLSACFEAAKDVEEVAPFGSVGFTGQEIAEEDSVTGEEHFGCGFQGRVGSAGLLDDSGGGVEFFRE